MTTLYGEPLNRVDSAQLLNQVIDCAKAEGRNAIVIFDLDSTLLDNRPRQNKILNEYGAAHEIEVLMQSKAEHWQGWSRDLAMKNAGLSDGDITLHSKPFYEFWNERFFTSEYCTLDAAIIGAAHYVQAVQRTGARIMYITGRQKEMGPGSIISFENHAFPVPDELGVFLILKADLSENDDVYKERVYDQLKDQGKIVAAFDNEPTHINGYHTHFPDALCIHLATDHSLRDIPVKKDIPSIRDFSSFAE